MNRITRGSMGRVATRSPCRDVDELPEDRSFGIQHPRLHQTRFVNPLENLLASVVMHTLAGMNPARQRIVAVRALLLEVEQVERSARPEDTANLAQRLELRVMRQMGKHQAREDAIEVSVSVRQRIGKTLIE